MSRELEQQFQIALAEIGPIIPWFSEPDGLYLFEHPAYPGVDYLHRDPKVVIQRYQEVLRDFIADRLDGNLAEIVVQGVRGRGGYRPGAGRPKGSAKEPTKTVRLPVAIADWLKHGDNLEKLRRWMHG